MEGHRLCASWDGEKVRETKVIQHWKWKLLSTGGGGGTTAVGHCRSISNVKSGLKQNQNLCIYFGFPLVVPILRLSRPFGLFGLEAHPLFSHRMHEFNSP